MFHECEVGWSMRTRKEILHSRHVSIVSSREVYFMTQKHAQKQKRLGDYVLTHLEPALAKEQSSTWRNK